MKYNTLEICKAIVDFVKVNKDVLKYEGLCSRAGVSRVPLKNLISGRYKTLDREYIDKLLPHLYQYGFYYEIDLPYIQTTICRYFNVPIDKVKSNSRKGELVSARQFIFKFGREIAKLTLEKLGNDTGGKDHVTVMKAIERLDNLIETEHKTKIHYLALEKRLKQA